MNEISPLVRTSLVVACGFVLSVAGVRAADASKGTAPATNAVAAADTPEAKEAALAALFGKKESITNTLDMVMVWQTAGYRVAKCEVTQAQYEQVTGNNPSKFLGPQQPVERVSWTEANDFCQKLTDKERKEGKLPKTYRYALPTEAQWDDYVGNASLQEAIVSLVGDRREPMNVGLLAANDHGLHDVRGNVWEWCSTPVARGGSYMSHEDYLDVGFRFVGTADLKLEDIGFRCILYNTEPSSTAAPPK